MESTLNEKEHVAIEQLREATHFLNETKSIFETPLISLNGSALKLPEHLNVYLKLENMQNTGYWHVQLLLF